MVPPTRFVRISIWCVCWRHKGFYSPSLTYMHLDFSPRGTDHAVHPLDVLLASN